MLSPPPSFSNCRYHRPIAPRSIAALWLYWILKPTKTTSKTTINQRCRSISEDFERAAVLMTHASLWGDRSRDCDGPVKVKQDESLWWKAAWVQTQLPPKQ